MSVHSISSSSRGGLEIHHVSPPFTEMSHDYEEGIVSLSDDIQNKTKENMNFILFILLLSNLWSILLIVIPVQYTIGSDNLYYKYEYMTYQYFVSYVSFSFSLVIVDGMVLMIS